MIVDHLKEWDDYGGLRHNLGEKLEWLAGLNMDSANNIGFGDPSVLTSCSTIDTRVYTGGNFEAHKRCIDIHVCIEGAERIKVSHVDRLKKEGEYDADKDIQWFSGDAQYDIVLYPGDFLVCFPHDAHIPGLCVSSPSVLKKLVIKVPYNLYGQEQVLVGPGRDNSGGDR